MNKQVGLNQVSLVLNETQIDVGAYNRILIGMYRGWDIEHRRERRIYDQLFQEGLFVPESTRRGVGQTYKLTKEGERRLEELRLTVQPDSYLKYLILLYWDRDTRVDYEGLRQRVHDTIPSELKDSIDVKIHIAEPGGRLVADPPPDGIEIMVTDDVELNVKL